MLILLLWLVLAEGKVVVVVRFLMWRAVVQGSSGDSVMLNTIRAV
jgi:hypothetical protein